MMEETLENGKQQSGRGIHDFMLSVLIWREKHISERSFVIVLALIVGILCGFAALTLKWLIHTISTALSSHIAINGGNYLYLLFPAIGIVLTMLYVRFVVHIWQKAFFKHILVD